jgi:gluconolactonase
MNKLLLLSIVVVLLVSYRPVFAASVERRYPQVNASPTEPTWPTILKKCFGLDMERDLRNPQIKGSAPTGLFRQVNPKHPVRFRPIIALGMSDRTYGGWYVGGTKSGDIPTAEAMNKHELWSFSYKQPENERKTWKFTPPPLDHGDFAFYPGDMPFGLWVSNDHFPPEPGVFTQPQLVRQLTPRLADQPHKVMIYPCTDPKTGRLIANSYLIGWEYSTNDDFQDVITRIDNVQLLPGDPTLPGILADDAHVQQLAGGFSFIEGPAWNVADQSLYFSDIPRSQILAYRRGTTEIVTEQSGNSNGLMFDKQGWLVTCEGADVGGRRRIARYDLKGNVEVLANEYEGQPLNSPNDLWLDQDGGVYFTDPRYGPRDTMAMEVEGVYYISPDGQLKRVIDNLVQPNGIAISPNGKWLYVVDNAEDLLYRYLIQKPGQLGEGQKLLHVTFPDGMTVDEEGRLYIACWEGINVADKEGRYLGLIPTPQVPANCTFGGPDNKTLFVAARSALYNIETQTRGWHVHPNGPKQ